MWSSERDVAEGCCSHRGSAVCVRGREGKGERERKRERERATAGNSPFCCLPTLKQWGRRVLWGCSVLTEMSSFVFSLQPSQLKRTPWFVLYISLLLLLFLDIGKAPISHCLLVFWKENFCGDVSKEPSRLWERENVLEIRLREEVLGSIELGVYFGFVLWRLMAEDRWMKLRGWAQKAQNSARLNH